MDEKLPKVKLCTELKKKSKMIVIQDLICHQAVVYKFREAYVNSKVTSKKVYSTFCKSTYSDESKQIKSCEYIQGTFFMHTKQFRDLCIRWYDKKWEFHGLCTYFPLLPCSVEKS